MVPLSLLVRHMSCVQVTGTSCGGGPGMGGSAAHPLGHGPLSSHKLTLSPVKSFLTFTSVALLSIHEKNQLPTEYPLATNADVNEQTVNAPKSKLK